MAQLKQDAPLNDLSGALVTVEGHTVAIESDVSIGDVLIIGSDGHKALPN